VVTTLVGLTVLGWLGFHLHGEYGVSPFEHTFWLVTAVSAFVVLCWCVGHGFRPY
jgi:hypothetical protein